jgi:hypothetical protein
MTGLEIEPAAPGAPIPDAPDTELDYLGAKIAREPADTGDWATRGQLAARRGRFEEAQEHLDRAIELGTDNVNTWHAAAGLPDEKTGPLLVRRGLVHAQNRLNLVHAHAFLQHLQFQPVINLRFSDPVPVPADYCHEGDGKSADNCHEANEFARVKTRQ